MKRRDYLPLAPALALVAYAFPHLFHLPVVRIQFLDTNVSATSIVSLMMLYVASYLLPQGQPVLWRFITAVTVVESAFISYEAVHSSLYFLHHSRYYNPDWSLKMLIFSIILYVMIYVIHKCRPLFQFDAISGLSFILFFTMTGYQVVAQWYINPIDDLSCVIHQTMGFWMWISIIKVKQ